MNQGKFWDTELITPPPRLQLKKNEIEPCGQLMIALLQSRDVVTGFELAKARTEIDNPTTFDEMTMVVEQTTAVMNSRFQLIDYLNDHGHPITTVAEDGRPAFAGGRREPVGFSAGTSTQVEAARIQGRTGLGKVSHNLERLHATGQLSAADIEDTRRALGLIGGAMAPTLPEAEPAA